MTSQTTKAQASKNVILKDQNVKKLPGKDGLQKSQPTKMVKKVELCLKEKPKQLAAGAKLTDGIKTADKPKVPSPGKPADQKLKTVADITDKSLLKDQDVILSQGAVKKESQNMTHPLEIKSDNKGSSSQLVQVKETENVKPVVMSAQEFWKKTQNILPVVESNLNPTSDEPKDETVTDMDIDIAGDENLELPTGNDESDGESGLSDISVSSVHTSDLSSFDGGISSTSSSSSLDSSSDEEETGLKLILKKSKLTFC